MHEASVHEQVNEYMTKAQCSPNIEKVTLVCVCVCVCVCVHVSVKYALVTCHK